MLFTMIFANFLLLLLGLLTGISALRDVRVSVPSTVKAMDTVTLQCEYDLEGEPLYTVKWYKGNKEFYRYIPKELPDTQVFPLAGVVVDLTESTHNRVVIRNVTPEATGKYTCEVSSDAPNFFTYLVFGTMIVADIPEEDPILTVEKELLEVGSTLRGNCTSPPSFPPANLTWFLNGKEVEVNNKHLISSSTNTRRASVRVVGDMELEVTESTFRGGKARLGCSVNIFDLYNKSREVVLEEEGPRPMSSLVSDTLEAASGSVFHFGTHCIQVLCIVAIIR